MKVHEPTKAIILTGSGRGAVGVVRVFGPDALSVASAGFQPNRGRSLKDGPANRPRFGRFAGDDVIALVLDGNPPEVEIQGHGGQAALNAILSELTGRGVVVANDSIDITEAAKATEALRHAPTLKVAGILLDQADGALDRELREIGQLADRDEAMTRARILLERSKFGLKLVVGWTIALTGRPNVGKSRLHNALAGFDRSIVSPLAGTTRDVVRFRTAIDGWPVEFADTAGIRSHAQGLESAGIERARETGLGADLVLLVLDRSEPMNSVDQALIATYPNALIVANKSDLPAAWDGDRIAALAVSAERGDGLDALILAISRKIVPDPPDQGIAVPFRAEHVSLLHAILSSS